MNVYRNILTNECAKVIENNEKYKTVILQTEQDATISLSYSTFHKNWKKLNENKDNTVVKSIET